MTSQEKTEAKRYNAKLTAHLFARMNYNRDNKQYAEDYKNRFKHFKKEY